MQEKIKQLGIRLSVLADDSNCALWLSGGKDSRLLLEMMVRLNLKFAVLNFDAGWTKDQRKTIDRLIEEHSLIIYSYPPKFITLIGNGDDVSLAANYAVGRQGETVSVISDFVDGNRCAFDVKIKLSEQILAPVRFDVHIWGTKKGESHFAYDGKPMLEKDTFEIGETVITAPLFDWTDNEVLEALKFLNVDYEIPPPHLDTGNIVTCFACMKPCAEGVVYCPKQEKEIPPLEWNPEKNLENWRKLCLTHHA